jgi:alkylhydroperoxidase family enzyme
MPKTPPNGWHRAPYKTMFAIFRDERCVLICMKVLNPCMPGVLRLSYEIQKFEMKGIRLEPGLHFMVATLASQINGCGFCVDIARAMGIRKHLGMEKFNALSEYRTSPLFSDRERAALA